MSSRQLKIFLPLLCLAAGSLFAPALAHAQCLPGGSPQAAFRGPLNRATPRSGIAQAARERDMYVSVLNDKKAPAENIGPSDLVVREDGVAREILRVVPATDPLQIALLVDDSQAATSSIQRIREALSAFIDKVAVNGNQISFITLGDRPTLQVDGTTDAKRLKKNGVDRLFAKPSAGMYLMDAINDTAKGFKKREATRPVIVAVMTDGVEFSNGHYQTTLDALTDAGAAFYALVLTNFEPDNTRDEIRNRNIILDRGTSEHGGHRDLLLSDMAFKDSLVALANELLHQYKVTYARPDTLLPPQKTTVEAKTPGLTARGQLVRVIGERAGR